MKFNNSFENTQVESNLRMTYGLFLTKTRDFKICFSSSLADCMHESFQRKKEKSEIETYRSEEGMNLTDH